MTPSIRDGYELHYPDDAPPFITFRDKIIGQFIWYPLHPIYKHAYIIEYGIWNPEASAREVMEATMFLWKELSVPVVGYVRKENLPFYRKMEKFGYARLVGVSHVYFPDQLAYVFESTHVTKCPSTG